MHIDVQPVFSWIALGSNQGNRLTHLSQARQFLESISEKKIKTSSIYETEPLGPADKAFYNAVIRIATFLTPEQLLKKIKSFEEEHGRDLMAPRWSNRPIDLDIIAMEKVHIDLDWLQIPHKEYVNRLFVLVPLQEVEPDWSDPVKHQSIQELIEKAPKSAIQKLELSW